jgi:hypothetical protein
MGVVREALSGFAVVNAVFWAALAIAWAFRPGWAEQLPWGLGSHERYRRSGPAWARLAASLAGFWAMAAGLYMVAGRSGSRAAVIVLFVLAACFLVVAVLAAGAVYRALDARSRARLAKDVEQAA